MLKPLDKLTASLLVAACALFAGTAHSETLTVPHRGPLAMQTAATTIEFDPTSLGTSPTVSVDGNVIGVPASSCVGAACSALGLTAAGDPVVVFRESGTNRVQVTLTYVTSFAGNYCAYTGPVAARNYDIVLADFTFPSANPEYRITSFMAPSDASCDIAYARVPTARPSFPVASLWTRLGRLPLNVVLVLDKSGSMSWTVPGSADIRWDRLTASVDLFTATWEALGAPPPPATVSSEGDPRDRLGLIFFSTTSVERNLGASSFFEERGASATPWSGTVSSLMAAEPVTGWTSVGAGLTNARARLDDVDLVLGDTAIVLLTDGEQNRPPCVVRVGETITPTPVPYPNSSSTYIDQCYVSGAIGSSALLEIDGPVLAQDITPRGPVFTIGLGEGGMGASAQLLDEISTETSGSTWFPNNGIAMDTGFVDSLVDNLKGGTVSLLDRTEETIPAQTPSGAPIPVAVDESVTRVVFLLSWSGSSFQEVALRLAHPDGSTPEPSLQSSGGNYRLVAFDTTAADAGQWVALVQRFSNQREPLDFQLSAYSVESRFGSRVSLTPGLGTGGQVEIVAELGWGNDLLSGLPAGAVTAFVLRPGENLGNILFESAYPQDFKLTDDSTPIGVKIDQLASDGDLIARIDATKASEAIPLVDAGDGRYAATFNELDVGGTYDIRVEFDWDDPRTGAIRRVQYIQRSVAVIPTAEDSEIDEILNSDGVLSGITLVLKDGFGNYVGPGFGNQIQVAINGSNSGNTVITDPEVKGVYTISDPDLTLGSDPQVTITYGDSVLADGKLSGIVGVQPDGQCAWYDLTCGPRLLKLIILALIILIILFLLFRKP